MRRAPSQPFNFISRIQGHKRPAPLLPSWQIQQVNQAECARYFWSHESRQRHKHSHLRPLHATDRNLHKPPVALTVPLEIDRWLSPYVYVLASLPGLCIGQCSRRGRVDARGRQEDRENDENTHSTHHVPCSDCTARTATGSGNRRCASVQPFRTAEHPAALSVSRCPAAPRSLALGG